MKNEAQIEYRQEHKISIYVLAAAFGLILSFVVVFCR